MSKTPEDLYQERLEAFTRALVVEFLEGSVDHLTVSEFLAENGEDSEDVANDVFNEVSSTLETILQRWLDD